MISKNEFKERRNKVLNFLADLSKEEKVNYKAVLKSGSQKTFANDVKYPFRVDSDFYYLTGFAEPDSVLVLDPHASNPYQLYVQAHDPLHAIWEGHREGLEGAKKNFDCDAAYDVDDFNEEKEPNTNKKSSSTKDVLDFVHSLRTIKSNAEIALMKKSAQISIQAHRVAQEICTTGIYEYELEAVLCQVFRSQGASGWAYPPIVASGANTCILHYTENNQIIKAGDLVLIDAGSEYQYYASDITRVFAADGKMTSEQKDVYDVVLQSQLAAIESVKAGGSFAQTHDLTTAIIAEGLKNLGYIKDKNNPEEIKKYYMHGTGHSLGMDVHDCGVDKKTSVYIPGMVTTIEPGIYIRDKNIGIRIEDDVLVTKDGYEVLTQELAK
ncbi:MAG: aminopeptidase P family protein [Candidatus Caenarcaniphilales bacterium]|jgi:Xaa-Pro aminopeptidase|nr:aminopeptidase P family protein [Candidatus Caenarcaniphilales bacterium]